MTYIEQALAEALREVHASWEDPVVWSERDAILAAEPMQTIARQGAAIARLAETGEVDPRLYFTDSVYHALAYRVHQGTPPDAAMLGDER